MTKASAASAWPTLPVGEWLDTLQTLHLFTQVVGKIGMVNSPWLNHSFGEAGSQRG